MKGHREGGRHLHTLTPYKSVRQSMILPYSSSDGFCRRTRYGVDAVGSAVLLVVQEPPGVRQASHLDAVMAHLLQLLGHAVHVQEHPGAPGAAAATRGRPVSGWDARPQQPTASPSPAQRAARCCSPRHCLARHSTQIMPVLSNNLTPQKSNPALTLSFGRYTYAWQHWQGVWLLKQRKNPK